MSVSHEHLLLHPNEKEKMNRFTRVVRPECVRDPIATVPRIERDFRM